MLQLGEFIRSAEVSSDSQRVCVSIKNCWIHYCLTSTPPLLATGLWPESVNGELAECKRLFWSRRKLHEEALQVAIWTRQALSALSKIAHGPGRTLFKTHMLQDAQDPETHTVRCGFLEVLQEALELKSLTKIDWTVSNWFWKNYSEISKRLQIAAVLSAGCGVDVARFGTSLWILAQLRVLRSLGDV